MTYKEFKELVESQGATDDTLMGLEDTPYGDFHDDLHEYDITMRDVEVREFLPPDNYTEKRELKIVSKPYLLIRFPYMGEDE